MSTGQRDSGLNGDYHHDVNLLLIHQEHDEDTIDSLKTELSKTKDRVVELERALLYYADECNFKNGDVPGHVYALDDGGHTARAALGLNQDQVKERILATYYTE